MTLRSIGAMLLAAVFSFSLVAQDNCPFERTAHLEAELKLGPAQGCGGVSYQVGGVSVSTVRDGCPLFSIYTPPHDIAVRSTSRTMIQCLSLQPITKVIFSCAQDWFLIFPIGSSCSFVQQLNVGTVPVLVSQPCPEHAEA
jgi:hypothetical protein